MKLNYALHVCCVFCLGIVLSVQPAGRNQANVNGNFKSIKKTEKRIVKQDAGILHSELLFK